MELLLANFLQHYKWQTTWAQSRFGDKKNLCIFQWLFKKPRQMYLFSENDFQVFCLFTPSGFNRFYHCFSNFFYKECLLAPQNVLVAEWLFYDYNAEKAVEQLKPVKSPECINFVKSSEDVFNLFSSEGRSLAVSNLIVSFLIWNSKEN